MAIGNYYPISPTVENADLFLGTKAGTNNTVNYTAQTVVDYLNINAKISIGGQLSFKFDIVQNIPRTISFSTGGGDGTPFSSITQLEVSSTDLSGSDVNIFLNYLNNTQILLSQQNQPNAFGHYKIVGYTVTSNPNFYTLSLEYLGGNGVISKDIYYDLVSLNFPAVIPIESQNLNDVLTIGNTSLLDAKIGQLYLYDTSELDYGHIALADSGYNLYNALGGLIARIEGVGIVLQGSTYNSQILTGTITANRSYTLPNASGTIALTSDLSVYVPYTGATGAVNLGAYNLTVNSISVGKGAGTGINNTAIGNSVLISNTTGTYNVAIGFESLKLNTTGGTNIAIGRGVMPFNTTGGGNTALGYNSMFSNTTGGNNVSIGNGVMTGNTTGSGNVAIGYNTLTVQSAVSNTIAIGQGALQFNNSGLLNTAVGYASMTANTSGSNNVALGSSSLQNNNTGSGNVAIGLYALLNNSTASNNVAVGLNAMQNNTIGTSNAAIGYQALYSNIGGNSNTAVGYEALRANTSGSINTSIGSYSLNSNTTGTNNIANGSEALRLNTIGNNNTAIGTGSLRSNVTSDDNTAVGYGALYYTTIGNNTAIGRNSMFYNTTGSNNTAIGLNSGTYIANKITNASILNDSVMIGTLTSPLASNQTNQIVIGYNATGAGSDTVTIGNTSITTTRLRGNVQGGAFVKDGGTSLQYLMADGTTSTGPSLTGYVPTSRTLTINGTTQDLTADRSWSVGTVTSVGLSMPSAFTVSSSPIIGAGTIAVTGAGTSSQYIRGDGQLATMPSGGGGGSSVSYYLNGSIASSVAGYQQLSNTAVIGAGTDFSLIGNGLITQFLTDVGNPNRIEIPGGAWNFEMWFSMSSNGGTPKFYVELLKYDGITFTTIANNSAVPESITGGTIIDLYLTSLAVPTTTLLSTDRLAIRVYIVDNSGGRTATLHTEDNHLCEILTTFSGGVTSLNGLTANTQYLAVGTTGTDFNINSLVDTHTFNLPTASATNRGALSTTDWTAFNGKFTLPALTSGSVLFSNGTTIAQDNSNFFWDDTNNRLGIGTITPSGSLHIKGISTLNTDLALRVETSAAGMLLQVDNGGFTRVSGPTARLYVNVASAGFGARLVVAGNAHFSTSGTGNAGAFSIDQGGTSSASRTIWYDETGGIKNLIQGKGTSYITSGNTLFNTTTDQGGILQIKAGGALSTDIALRVRNSADTADLMTVNGLGNLTIGSTLSPSNVITSFYSSGENRVKLYSTAQTTDSLQFFTNGGAYGSAYGEFGFLFKNTSTQMASINFDTRAGAVAPFRFFVNPIGASAIDAMDIFRTGSVGIGTSNTEITSAILTANSTTQGFLPPRMTTTQKNAIATPATGLIVYDTDLISLYQYNGTAWTAVGGGGGGGSTPVKLTSQTLTAASWTLVGSYYTYSFSNVNVTTSCDVSVTPQNASYLTAYNAQVLPFVGVAAGVATLYSQFPPAADMVVDIVITQTV